MEKIDTELKKQETEITDGTNSIGNVSDQLDTLSTAVTNLSNEVQDIQALPGEFQTFQQKVDNDIEGITALADTAMESAQRAETRTTSNTSAITAMKGEGWDASPFTLVQAKSGITTLGESDVAMDTRVSQLTTRVSDLEAAGGGSSIDYDTQTVKLDSYYIANQDIKIIYTHVGTSKFVTIMKKGDATIFKRTSSHETIKDSTGAGIPSIGTVFLGEVDIDMGFPHVYSGGSYMNYEDLVKESNTYVPTFPMWLTNKGTYNMIQTGYIYMYYNESTGKTTVCATLSCLPLQSAIVFDNALSASMYCTISSTVQIQ